MQPPCGDGRIKGSSEVVMALKDLYIVSSAAAQRGAHALEVLDSQWRALARETREARAILDQQIASVDMSAVVLLQQLSGICEDLLDRRAMHHETPSAVWREVGRLGRDAYECLTST